MQQGSPWTSETTSIGVYSSLGRQKNLDKKKGRTSKNVHIMYKMG
jgi:hypothetical protein